MHHTIKSYINSIFILESTLNKDFQHMSIRKTATRGFTFTTFIVIIEFFMILVSYFVPSFFPEGYLISYRYHYIVLFLVSFLAIFILKYFYKKNADDDKMLYIISVIVVAFSILWGASVTLLDLSHTPQISVYLTFILFMSIAPQLSPRIMAGIYLFAHTIFIIAIPFYQKASDIVFSTRLNSSIFVFFAWLISRQLFKEGYSNFIKDRLIASQNIDLQNSNSKLLRISRQDSLTGLYNRLSLEVILNEQWSLAFNNNESLSILMIDIDSFKPFNDTYGHIKGDECLIQVSQTLKKLAETNHGFAFRYGGDEFCIIFENIELNQLLNIIDIISTQVSALSISISDTENVNIHLTIGYCHDKATNYDNPWLLINHADKHLYQNKSLK